MPNLASPATIDTQSTDGNCLYSEGPIGGTAIPTTVVANKAPLKIVAAAPNPYVCASIAGAKINPLVPAPCQLGVRTLRPAVNTSVIINGMLPAVTGDEAQLLLGGSPRPLTGPFIHPNILIGTNL